MIRWLVVACAALLVCASCVTRTPQDPEGTRGTYLPPTTPGTVMDNFRNALEEKNTENFMLCLADAGTRSKYPYVFEPSAEARARYQSLFDSWALDKERQSFLSMIARLPAERRPMLTLLSLNINYSSPDSTVHVADYSLLVEHDLETVPTVLTGTMVLTMTPEASGLWSISRWRDARRASDTVEATWSLLKASLTN
jgi:hypothetical protein